MATITSNGTGGGNWLDSASWAGSVAPAYGDTVSILSNDVIVVSGVCVGGADYADGGITIAGELRASRTVNSSLTAFGNIIVDDGGTLDYGKSDSIIPDTISAQLILNASTTLEYGKYGLLCKPSAAGFYIHGAIKTTNTHLVSKATSGDSSISVNDANGWAVGDTLVFGKDSNYSNTVIEKAIISAISSNTITLSAAIVGTYESLERVGNLSKSVNVTNFSWANGGTSYPAYVTLQSNATTSLNSRAINHVSFSHMGGTGGSDSGSALTIDGKHADVNPYISVTDVTISDVKASAFTVFAFPTTNRLHISNLLIVPMLYPGVRQYAGSSFVLDSVVILGGNPGITSSYGEGGVGCEINNSWISSAYVAIDLASAQGLSVTNSVFVSCNTVVSLGFGAKSNFYNCNLGFLSGSYAGPVNHVCSARRGAYTNAVFHDCDFNVSQNIINESDLIDASSGFSIVISNKDKDPKKQYIYKPSGVLLRDNGFFISGDSSLKMSPTSADVQLTNSWDIFAPDNAPVVVTGYIIKNTTYGAVDLPTVTLSGLGIVDSVWTMEDTLYWQQFVVYATQTSGADGILNLTISGVAPNAVTDIWVDKIVSPSSVPVNSGNFSYWALGVPAKLIAGNLTSADQIWSQLTTNIQTPGSIGEFIKTNLDGKVSSIENTLSGLHNFDPTVDVVSRVTLVDTTTTNSDMVATGITANEVWQYSARSLTDTSGYTLATSQYNNVAKSAEISALNNFNPSTQSVIASNMRGTDSANTLAPDNTGIAAIKAKTDNLPADPAGVSDLPSTITVADVWDSLVADIVTIGSIGELLKTNIDAKISSISNSGTSTLTAEQVWAYGTRSLSDKSGFSLSSQNNADIAAAVDTSTILAKSAEISALNDFNPSTQSVIASNMRGTDSANTLAPDNTGIAAIKAKTDNLPTDPASASGETVTSQNINDIASAVWNKDL